MTFVASTGDYGTADPQYPAFSPNVVAVGGTSLTLNADSSYNNETGWGYYSDTAGAFIASGGGLSLYEPEPAYQQGVQSTGSRTTPDVSFVADPATGAWIADPYNLNPSDPFEVVGGTSLSAPAWAGLLALVDQGRAEVGESALNSTSSTDTQQALYMLPQSDYNMIASGTNGYSAHSGYNLVTGLGTPVANLLVPDLIAYQGPGTSYAGSPVGPLQNADLVNTGADDGAPMDVFSVFDALTSAGDGVSETQGQVPSAIVNSPMIVNLAPAGGGRNQASALVAGNITFGPAANFSQAGITPSAQSGLGFNSTSTLLISQQSASLSVDAVVKSPTTSPNCVALQQADHAKAPVLFSTRPRTSLVPNSVLDDLVSNAVLARRWQAPDAFGGQVVLWDGVTMGVPIAVDPVPAGTGFPVASQVSTGGGFVALSQLPREPASWRARLAVILLAAGSCGPVGARARRPGFVQHRSPSRSGFPA